MNNETKELIEKMGEDKAMKILQNSYDALTEDYMTFNHLKEEIRQYNGKEVLNSIYTKYKKVGLIPINEKILYGRKHLYNYLIADYIVDLICIEQATIVKNKLINDQDNTLEVMEIYEELMRENIRNSNQILKGLAMMSKGKKLL